MRAAALRSHESEDKMMQPRSASRFALRSPVGAQQPPVLLCFSHLRWNFVFQRPQHLLTRAARTQQVIFFEEPVFECGIRAQLRISTPEPNIMVATPCLPRGLTENEADLFQRSLLNDLLARQELTDRQQRERLVLWYYTPMALRFSGHLDAAVSVYDCMDELSNFKGAPAELKELERRLLERAKIVFTGGLSLYEAKRRLHRSVHAFPSSIDAAHFGKARDHEGPEPADQARLGRPRFGFFGVIDERLDTELVAAIADLRPDWQFAMVGPVVKIDPETLPQRPNIHWFGQKDYRELPGYLAGWDLGIMPFAINDATRYISPTKTPEFLAAGLPVVSTPVPDVVRTYGNGLVDIAATPEDFVARMEEAMARPREAWLEKVDSFLATTSWDRTWASMATLIEQARQGRQRSLAAQQQPLAIAAEGAANV